MKRWRGSPISGVPTAAVARPADAAGGLRTVRGHRRSAPSVPPVTRAGENPGGRIWQAVRVKRVAAIDCGTNSIRLLIADVDAAGTNLREVTRLMEIVRLGQGVDQIGRAHV